MVQNMMIKHVNMLLTDTFIKRECACYALKQKYKTSRKPAIIQI